MYTFFIFYLTFLVKYIILQMSFSYMVFSELKG